MSSNKKSVIWIVVFCLSVMMVTPAAPVAASPLTDFLSQVGGDTTGSSGNGLMNILLGLVMGKLFGGVSNASPGVTSKVLGASTVPPGVSAGDNEGQAIVASAQKYMGVPYVWGGVTPDGWDCSGFTQYVMKQNGIDLPRTAAEQFAVGTPVDKDQLQAGDLVFFTTYKPGASHVGFYLGGGKFIHASSVAKQVTISVLDAPYYSAHYIGARRYTR